MQVFTGIVFAGFFWMLDAVYQPFENQIENQLQTFARGVIFLTLVIGGMMQTSRDGSSAYKTAKVNEEAAGVVLVLINASVFVLIAVLFLLNFTKAEMLESIKCCFRDKDEENSSGPKRQRSTIERQGRRGSTASQHSVRRAASSGVQDTRIGAPEDEFEASKHDTPHALHTECLFFACLGNVLWKCTSYLHVFCLCVCPIASSEHSSFSQYSCRLLADTSP